MNTSINAYATYFYPALSDLWMKLGLGPFSIIH